MTKSYIVMEIGYEFNDEINYVPDNGGGAPIKSFSTKKKAQEYANCLSIKKIKGLRLGYYTYNMQDLVSDMNRFCKLLGRTDGELDSWDYAIPKDISDKKAREILDLINLKFYEVVEVPNG